MKKSTMYIDEMIYLPSGIVLIGKDILMNHVTEKEFVLYDNCDYEIRSNLDDTLMATGKIIGIDMTRRPIGDFRSVFVGMQPGCVLPKKADTVGCLLVLLPKSL
jgi:hypothetical protein